MRYVIYEAKEDFETIEKQLDFIKSYVYLESLRVGDHLKVEFTVRGDNLSLKVAPLLFIAFVENAFKHCSKDKAKKPFISIIIEIEKRDRINFYIENTKETELYNFNPPAPGIGLQNVRKRIELLYPGRHTLVIKESNDKFIVDLTLIVNENPLPDH